MCAWERERERERETGGVIMRLPGEVTERERQSGRRESD